MFFFIGLAMVMAPIAVVLGILTQQHTLWWLIFPSLGLVHFLVSWEVFHSVYRASLSENPGPTKLHYILLDLFCFIPGKISKWLTKVNSTPNERGDTGIAIGFIAQSVLTSLLISTSVQILIQ